jgi:alcohol dehydrogenase
LLVAGFARVLADPNDVQARGAMLVGSHLAGSAIENSMLGAAHALANPLSAHFNTTHGFAVGVMLPHVVRYNAPVVAPLYARLSADIGLCDEKDPHAPELLAERIELLLALAGAPATLADCGVDQDMIPQMAEEASAQWTGRFNPRPVDAASLQELYECAFSPAE